MKFIAPKRSKKTENGWNQEEITQKKDIMQWLTKGSIQRLESRWVNGMKSSKSVEPKF